jgi:hypothetical protein
MRPNALTFAKDLLADRAVLPGAYAKEITPLEFKRLEQMARADHWEALGPDGLALYTPDRNAYVSVYTTLDGRKRKHYIMSGKYNPNGYFTPASFNLVLPKLGPAPVAYQYLRAAA